MSVKTAVEERALALTLVKVLARHVLQNSLVAVQYLILLVSAFDKLVRWDNHVALGSTEWTQPKVRLVLFLRVLPAPIADAFQTKRMVAVCFKS